MSATTSVEGGTSPGEPVALAVKGLTKSYRVHDRPLDALLDTFRRHPRGREHEVLSDVSFDLRRGEVLGVIGPNGAGKSTLLKIIAGTLSASQGDVLVNGTISAILELGTGFHPDYTGFDNIMLGGLAQGMTRDQVLEQRGEIIEFSELGEAINQPFRTYSSGMQARLTFSTAIHIDPDILIIDEALAAGDAYFVHKCLGRIREICEGGASVLLVSHSEAMIAELCDRAMWIESGRVKAIGQADTVAKMYTQSVWMRTGEKLALDNEHARLEREGYTYELGGDSLRITDVRLEDQEGNRLTEVRTGQSVSLVMQWSGNFPGGLVMPAFRIDSSERQAVTGYEGYKLDEFVNNGQALQGEGTIRMTLPRLELGSGTYFISVSLSRKMVPRDKDAIIHYLEKAYKFLVPQLGPWPSSFAYEPRVEVTYE